MATPDFYIKRRDTAPSVTGQLTDGDGTVINLAGASVRFKMGPKPPNKGGVIDAAAVIVDQDTGEVRYDWAAGDLVGIDGDFFAEFEAVLSGGAVVTFPNDGHLLIHIERDLS